ncbi:hypothetical protein IAU59_007640 [Kwoniella sp. CBS 9459]
MLTSTEEYFDIFHQDLSRNELISESDMTVFHRDIILTAIPNARFRRTSSLVPTCDLRKLEGISQGRESAKWSEMDEAQAFRRLWKEHADSKAELKRGRMGDVSYKDETKISTEQEYGEGARHEPEVNQVETLEQEGSGIHDRQPNEPTGAEKIQGDDSASDEDASASTRLTGNSGATALHDGVSRKDGPCVSDLCMSTGRNAKAIPRFTKEDKFDSYGPTHHLARLYLQKEGSYQALVYLGITARLYNARLGMFAVNSKFTRMIAVDPSTIDVECNQFAFSCLTTMGYGSAIKSEDESMTPTPTKVQGQQSPPTIQSEILPLALLGLYIRAISGNLRPAWRFAVYVRSRN